MVAIIKSVSLNGMTAIPVNVEVTVCKGLPQFTIIGLPDKAIQEARERVIAALKENGVQLPLKKIIVNLAPADLKKDGGKFDLPIAIGILVASGLIEYEESHNIVVLGEMSLDGNLRSIKGILAMVLGAIKQGARQFIIPANNSIELQEVTNILIGPAINLIQATEYYSGRKRLLKNSATKKIVMGSAYNIETLFDIKGQPLALRAALVAAAGRHNLLLFGPAGVGKTMLAKRLPYLMSPMTNAEALETTAIYSLFNWNEKQANFIRERPFRAPHHSSSDISIIGGGTFPKPGEISLAHNGILFLDEFQEFKKNVLNMLRQPLQDKRVIISRSAGSVSYPADFLLACAMNSCSCGNFLDEQKQCVCSPHQIKKYFSKIAGPLLDRIDLQIQMPRREEYLHNLNNDICVTVKVKDAENGLEQAAYMQQKRFRALSINYNSQLPPGKIVEYIRLTDSMRQLLDEFIKKYHPSSRAIESILKVTRTIADIEGMQEATDKHLLEAMQYRTLESKIMNLDILF